MTEEAKAESKKEVLAGRGLDVGTGFIVCATADEDGEVYTKSVRDSFLEIKPVNKLVYNTMKKGLKKAGIDFFESEGVFNILGDDSLYQSVESCFKLLGQMSVRLRVQLAEIDALTLQNASLRVVNYLLSLFEVAGNQQQTILPANKNVVASRLSIQPETFSRILTQLSQKGIIRVNGLDISTDSIERLKELARDGVNP